jgi:hypothetical protein
MKFDKRIRALEVEALENATILHFADGSTREICGPRYHLLDLFGAACRGDVTPEQSSQLELIRVSVAAEEPGGGRMIEVMQALMQPLIE